MSRVKSHRGLAPLQVSTDIINVVGRTQASSAFARVRRNDCIAPFKSIVQFVEYMRCSERLYQIGGKRNSYQSTRLLHFRDWNVALVAEAFWTPLVHVQHSLKCNSKHSLRVLTIDSCMIYVHLSYKHIYVYPKISVDVSGCAESSGGFKSGHLQKKDIRFYPSTISSFGWHNFHSTRA